MPKTIHHQLQDRATGNGCASSCALSRPAPSGATGGSGARGSPGTSAGRMPTPAGCPSDPRTPPASQAAATRLLDRPCGPVPRGIGSVHGAAELRAAGPDDPLGRALAARLVLTPVSEDPLPD